MTEIDTEPISIEGSQQVIEQYSLVLSDDWSTAIVDTDALMPVTFNINGFEGPIRETSLENLARLSGDSEVKGEGMMQWKVRDVYG